MELKVSYVVHCEQDNVELKQRTTRYGEGESSERGGVESKESPSHTVFLRDCLLKRILAVATIIQRNLRECGAI